MESAGVDWGAKMLGTGLSIGGLAAHNPAARSIPASRSSTPARRLKLFTHGLSSFALSLYIKSLRISPMPFVPRFGLLLRVMQSSAHERVAILRLVGMPTNGSHPQSLHMHIAFQKIRF